MEQVLRDDFGCRGANCRLYLTGHSRGGPLSTIAATLVNTSLATVGGVHTFGSCRVGDGNFQRLYNARLGNVTYNWWNRQDWGAPTPAGLDRGQGRGRAAGRNGLQGAGGVLRPALWGARGFVPPPAA